MKNQVVFKSFFRFSELIFRDNVNSEKAARLVEKVRIKKSIIFINQNLRIWLFKIIQFK